MFSPPNPSPESHTQTALIGLPQLSPAHIDSSRIALASPLLMYVLRTALHTLVRTVQDSVKSKRARQRPHTTLTATDAYVHIDKVLDHLLEYLLLPLLRALAPLCSARLAALVSPSLMKDRDKASRAVGKGKDKDKDKRTTTSVNPSNKTDVRTDVFALIGTSLEALDALPPLVRPPGPGGGSGGNIAGGIRHRLGLETIRELEALYAVPPSPSSPSSSSLQPSSQQPLATPSEPPPLPTPNTTPLSAPSQPQPRTQQRPVPESRTKRLERLAGTRVDRVRALAARDAGWFLASTLNLCVTPAPTRDPATVRTDHAGGLLGEALLDRIGKLVRSVAFGGSGQWPSNPSDAPDIVRGTATNSKFTIDPVCQNMLLAICERAMSHLASS